MFYSHRHITNVAMAVETTVRYIGSRNSNAMSSIQTLRALTKVCTEHEGKMASIGLENEPGAVRGCLNGWLLPDALCWCDESLCVVPLII